MKSLSAPHCLPLLSWTLALLVSWTGHTNLVRAQSSVPSQPAELDTSSTRAVENADSIPPNKQNVLAFVRISASFLNRAGRDFHHHSSVDRTILGTHSVGNAWCDGRIDFQLSENTEGVSMECHISGTVSSRTRGVNGPAILYSSAHSEYSAVKPIELVDRKLVAGESALQVQTRLQLERIASSLPGLRGRLVRRVANRKANSQLPQARQIVECLTEKELRDHIDREVEQRVQAVNARLQASPVLQAFVASGYELAIRSQADCATVTLLANDSVAWAKRPLAVLEPQTRDVAQPRGEFELWLPVAADLSINEGQALLAGVLPGWLHDAVDVVDGKRDLIRRVTTAKYGEWLVINLQNQ